MTCSAPGCTRPVLARGLCSADYARAYRAGKLGKVRTVEKTPLEHAPRVRRDSLEVLGELLAEVRRWIPESQTRLHRRIEEAMERSSNLT